MFEKFVPPPKGPLSIEPDFVAQVAACLEPAPRGFMPPAADRQAWQATGLDTAGRESWVRRVEQSLTQPIAKLTDELYLDFMESGKREPYTVPYNQWIDRASALALAESLEFKGRFLAPLRETIEEILAERSWVYPMHDGPTGWPYFKGGHIYIDLGAAVRAAELATIDAWLGEQLGADLRARVRAEIRRRIVDPYLGHVYGDDRARGWWWVISTTNWNSVCHAGVVYATLALVDDPQVRAKVAASAVRHTELYFQGFTDDGYISEGLGYWNYGYGHFTVLAETLLRATGGKINLYTEHAAKVGAVASYPIRCEIAPGIYPAFSDCAFGARPTPWVFRVLARHVELPSAVVESKPDHSMSGTTGYFRDVDFAPAPVVAKTRIPILGYEPLRSYFNDAGVLVMRSTQPERGIAAAVKGGHNAEMHNHNDVGSYTITCDGRPVMIDPGLEIYHLRTFSDRRYESKILSSYGHPVPLIDRCQQAVGREAEGGALETDFTNERDRFVVEMAPAYPVPGLVSAKRTFGLDRTGATSFTIVDEIELERAVEIETALITFGEVSQLSGGSLLVNWNGGSVRITIDTNGEAFTLREEELDEKLPGELRARRIGIALAKPVVRARISVTMTPP